MSPAGTAIFIDAKQRAVLSIDRTKDPAGPDHVVCTEPSPDALSVAAAAGGFSFANAGKVNGAAQLATAEGAGSIGLRTQSITLMRDGMYRICEGYADKALNAVSFETLLRRYQGSMVGILAIEQLTGATVARQITLGGASGTGNSDALLQVTDKAIAAQNALTKDEAALAGGKATLKQLTDEQAKADAAVDTAKMDPANNGTPPTAVVTAATGAAAKVADQKKKVGDQETLAANSQRAFEALEATRVAALAAPALASVKVAFADQPQRMSDEAVKALGASIEGIVKATLGMPFSNEFCPSVLAQAQQTAPSTGTPFEQCMTLLQTTVDRHNADAAAVSSVAAFILKNQATLKADEVVKLLSAVTGVAGAPPPSQRAN